MRKKSSLALVVASLALLLSPAVASAEPKPPTRVDICHFDSDTGFYTPITIASTAVPSHLRNHPDGLAGSAVPGQRGYTFGPTCQPLSQLVTVNFDDIDLSSGEVQLASYGGFSWTKGWTYRPGVPDPLGYGVSSAPNIGFIGFPLDGNPVVATSQVGDVGFTSVFLTNPTSSGTDPDGPITVTIEGWHGGTLVGTQQVVLADGSSQTVPLTFDDVDTLKMSANGKYFGFDDLTYFPAP